MRYRQGGMTLIGTLLIILVVGLWVYSSIRLTPKYLEYMKVAATLEKVRDEFSSNPESTEFMLRKAVERHFDIESVTAIDSNDIEITRDGGTFLMRAAYQETVRLAYNVSFLIEFDKTVEVAAR